MPEACRDRSVWGAKVPEHREVLEVARGNADTDLFGSGGDREVGDADARVASTPAATELAGATRHGFADRNPGDQSEQPVGRSTL